MAQYGCIVGVQRLRSVALVAFAPVTVTYQACRTHSLEVWEKGRGLQGSIDGDESREFGRFTFYAALRTVW